MCHAWKASKSEAFAAADGRQDIDPREENAYSGRNYPELGDASRDEGTETSLIAALDRARILSTALALQL